MTLVEALTLVAPDHFVCFESHPAHVSITVWRLQTKPSPRFLCVAGIQLPSFVEHERDIVEMLQAYFAPTPEQCALRAKKDALT